MGDWCPHNLWFVPRRYVRSVQSLMDSIIACHEGLGKHIWNPTVQLETIVKVGKPIIRLQLSLFDCSQWQILWACEFLYGTVIPLTKLSIIFFYYRLFPVPLFRRLLHLVLFLVIDWWIAIVVVAIVQCRPYSYFWTQYVDPTSTGRCINIPSFFIGNGAASVVLKMALQSILRILSWSSGISNGARRQVEYIIYLTPLSLAFCHITRGHLAKQKLRCSILMGFGHLPFSISEAIVLLNFNIALNVWL